MASDRLAVRSQDGSSWWLRVWRWLTSILVRSTLAVDACGYAHVRDTTRHATCDMTGEDEPARAIPRAAKPGPHRAVGVFIGWQRELDGRDLYFNRSGAQTVSCMHLELIRV